MVILRLPSITAPTADGKIEQMRNYLYTTIKDINYALNNIEKVEISGDSVKELSGESIFAMIKPLIIKSSDILNSYYDIIRDRLEDEFVSQEDFDKLNVWFRISEGKLEIGRMSGDTFTAVIIISSSGLDLKSFTGTTKYRTASGSITDYVKNAYTGMNAVTTTTTTTGLPSGYGKCVGFVHKVSSTQAVVQLTDLATGHTSQMVQNNGQWGSWVQLN